MRKFATTIIALAVFVGLLIWVTTKERGRVPEKEELLAKEINAGGGLVGIEAVKFDTPSVVNAGKPLEKGQDPAKRIEHRRLALEKRGDDWFITKPFESMADPDDVKLMVEAIERLKPTVRKDADPNAKDFGLDNPTLKVTVKLKNGKVIDMTLGENTPVGAKVFAKIEGREGLYLFPSTFTTEFQKEAATLRDTKLARFDKQDVVAVTFVNKHGTIAAEKRQKGEDVDWRITKPGEYKGDEWSITTAFGKLTETEAKDFVEKPGDLRKYGLDKPRVKVAVELKDGKSVEVLVGKQTRKSVKTSEYSDTTEEKDLVYAMRTGRNEVLLVDSTLFDDLNKDLMAMRDNHVLDFKRDKVKSIQVTRREGYSFTVNRAGDDWVLASPAGPAKKTKVDDILWDLSDLEAREYMGAAVDLKAIGLAVPGTVITLEFLGGKPVKVKFGDKVKKGDETLYYCQVNDDKQVYKVPQLVINDLPGGVDDIKQSPEDLKKTDGELPDLSGTKGDTPPAPSGN